MNVKTLEDLLAAATDNPSVSNLEPLLTALRAENNLNHPENTGLLDLMLEAWEEPYNAAQAAFCLELFSMNVIDSQLHRKALAAAIKTLLPPYLNKSGYLRTLGFRDASVTMHESIRRFHNLLKIKNGLVVFIADNARWGVVDNLDAVNGVASISPMGGGAGSSVPMDRLLSTGKFFNAGSDVVKISDRTRKPLLSGVAYRALVASKTLVPMTENEIQQLAMATLVPEVMSAAEFSAWYNSEQTASTPSGGRRSCNARSLDELKLLLDKEDDSMFSSEDTEAFKNFFANLKPASIARNEVLAGEMIARVSNRLDASVRHDVFMNLEGKCRFLPAEPANAPLENFTVYGELNVKVLESFFQAIMAMKDMEYLAKLATRLPLKALNILLENFQAEDMKMLFNLPGAGSGADLLLWIWKNRKKRSAEYLELINFPAVVRVLNLGKLPKAWSAAQRELKTQLLDKADFQQQLLDEAGDNARIVTSALQGALFFTPGERQSMLVKLARLSQDIREHLESGVGQKMLESKDKQAQSAPADESLYTSLASHRRLLKELDDIINIHMPENREALKTARAHGDFRENSEFDAAKERRNFLSRRRTELEHSIARVQGMDFSLISVEKTAVIGSKVTLKMSDNSEEVYYLLGAWDGDPEKRYLSYKTRLGEALYGRSEGAELELPGERKATLLKVEALPPEVLADMK